MSIGWVRAREKRAALKEAEQRGIVADSLDVRKALLDRMKSGEITFEEMQKELAGIKRNAKKNGKITREEVYRRG